MPASPVKDMKPVREANSGEARMNKVAIIGSLTAIGLVLAAPSQAQFQRALGESRATADEAKKSQQRIDQLDDETAQLLNEFRADQKQLDASRRYNRSLERTISNQERQIGRIQEDIENVGGLQQAIEPLMEDMVAAFEKFVEADLPFNLNGPTGRLLRAQRMRENLEDPNKSAAEKYRTIIEGYKLEAEFGRTVNFSQGTINVDGAEISGDFLQVGRVELLFKTEDDSVLKAWDNSTKSWSDISQSYVPDVKIAMRIAKGQAAPTLFALPLKRAE
ncbi:MAG: DUF3450 domain-containing protein [Pseudomonadota bacterium]